MYRALILGVGICVILAIAWSAGIAQPFVSPQKIYRPSIDSLSPQRRAVSDKIRRADFAHWESLNAAAGGAKSEGYWAKAENDYRMVTLLRFCLCRSDAWVELGLMRDYQGKHKQAFQAYYKGFGIGSHHGPSVSGGPDIAEAAARCGLMCEDRGLHADACECYYTARRSLSRETTLPMTLNASRTSPAAVRLLLAISLRDAQDQDKNNPGPF